MKQIELLSYVSYTVANVRHAHNKCRKDISHILIVVIQSLYASCICICTGSCKNSQIAHSNSSEHKDSDSIASIVELNPDTSYSSIDVLDYEIECLDSMQSGILTDYSDRYQSSSGIFTFRNDIERSADFLKKERLVCMHQPDTIITEWIFSTNHGIPKTTYGTWGGGTGWTGQPLYVNWPDSIFSFYKQNGTMREKAGNKEIIVSSLCGYVYFIDFETGDSSRDSIDIHHPVKGTAMLDPTLNGLLYVGHGVAANHNCPCGQVTIDLKKHSVTDIYPIDKKAWRGWNAYDSSPIRIGQFVFRPGENGTIYKWLASSVPTLHSTLKFRVKGDNAAGIEASMAAWRNYGYVNDNHGNIICFNLDNLRPVWHYNIHDDCDCTPVISHEADGTYLYTGCEVDRTGVKGNCYFVKLNALNGELIWKVGKPCNKCSINGKHFDGGYYASPLLGRANCRELIFINRVLNTEKQNGELVAFDKSTGQEVYTTPLLHYAWSSPIGIESADGKFTLLTGDTAGRLYLIDGITGKIICSQLIGSNFESSPIIVGNRVIIGSRGSQIFKLRIE